MNRLVELVGRHSAICISSSSTPPSAGSRAGERQLAWLFFIARPQESRIPFGRPRPSRTFCSPTLGIPLMKYIMAPAWRRTVRWSGVRAGLAPSATPPCLCPCPSVTQFIVRLVLVRNSLRAFLYHQTPPCACPTPRCVLGRCRGRSPRGTARPDQSLSACRRGPAEPRRLRRHLSKGAPPRPADARIASLSLGASSNIFMAEGLVLRSFSVAPGSRQLGNKRFISFFPSRKSKSKPALAGAACRRAAAEMRRHDQRAVSQVLPRSPGALRPPTASDRGRSGCSTAARATCTGGVHQVDAEHRSAASVELQAHRAGGLSLPSAQAKAGSTSCRRRRTPPARDGLGTRCPQAVALGIGRLSSPRVWHARTRLRAEQVARVGKSSHPLPFHQPGVPADVSLQMGPEHEAKSISAASGGDGKVRFPGRLHMCTADCCAPWRRRTQVSHDGGSAGRMYELWRSSEQQGGPVTVS